MLARWGGHVVCIDPVIDEEICVSSYRRAIQTLIPPLSIMGVFCLIYIPNLGNTITYDESITYFFSAQSPWIALFDYDSPNNHLLHSFFVWLSTTLLGGSEMAIRLPAFSFALMAVGYAYRIGYRLQGWQLGVIVATLMMAVPMFNSIAYIARGYTLHTLLSLIFFEIMFFNRGAVQGTAARVLLVVTATLIITLPISVTLIAVISAWKFLDLLRERDFPAVLSYFMPLLVGGLIGVIFYLPSIVLGVGDVEEFSNRFGYETLHQLLTELTTRMTTASSSPILVIGLLLGIIVMSMTQRRLLMSMVALFGGTLVLAVMQKWLTGVYVPERIYVYFVPFLSLIAAVGWLWLMKRLPTYTQFAAVGLAVVLLLMTVVDTRHFSEPSSVARLQAAIEQHRTPQDAIILGCCWDYPLAYNNPDGEIFRVSETTENYVLITSRYFPFERLYDLYITDQSVDCTAEMWNTFEVYTCPTSGS